MTLYSYATSQVENNEGFVSAVLNTYWNILRNHPRQKNREYHIAGDYSSKVEVYYNRESTDKAKKKVIELGWDNVNKRWYTDAYNSSVKFDSDFKKLKPFTNDEFKNLSANMKSLYSKEGLQQNVLKFLQDGFDMTPLDLSKASRIKPSDPKNLENFSENGIVDACKNLLSNNSGLFLAIEFSILGQDLSDLICDLINNLYKQNVKHIYVDEPGSSCYRAFEKFNSIPLDGRTTEDGSEDLLSQLRLIGVNMAQEKIKIYRAARLRGIEIWPIGTHHVPTTLKEFNEVSVHCSITNIDSYRKKLNDGEKFLVINGAAFYAIGEQQCIPSVRINYNTPIIHSKGQFDEVEINQITEEILINTLQESLATGNLGSLNDHINNIVSPKIDKILDNDDVVNGSNSNLYTQLKPLDALMMKKFGYDFTYEYSQGRIQEARVKKVTIPTSLFDACWSNDIDAIKYLLETGANFSERDEANQTPLDVAIATENQEAQNILKEKINVNKLCTLAQAKDIKELEQYVIELKASGVEVKKLINTAFQKGYTVLHYAAHAQNMEALKYLVKEGGSLTLKTDSGKIPTALLKQSTKFSEEFLKGWITQIDKELDKADKEVKQNKTNVNHM
ncbi:MAG: ankyrin repeat domain-containing protein [Legionellales bacterium]|jgi:hypothetical protein